MWAHRCLILTVQLIGVIHVTVGEHAQGKTYDYVIIGGGTAGLAVANRLTEDKRTTVLVVERGDFDNKPEAIIPYYANFLDTTVMQNFPSAPIPALNNASFRVPVASVVGGATVVNGMAYTRGSRSDYDGWEELGNQGWGWNDLLPYFKKSTTFDRPSQQAVEKWNITWDPAVYRDGPVHVSLPDFQYPDVATVKNAWRNTPGIVEGREVNAGGGPGLYWAPSTVDGHDKKRVTSRKAYYDPVYATRPNLQLLTSHTVTKILFQKQTATGVRIVSRANDTTFDVIARKEVIVAAGAVQTPHLLQISGVGPASVIQAAGQKVVKDLPGVGANLQDHAIIPIFFNVSNQSFPNPDSIARNATYNATVWEEYLTKGTGPIASGASNSLASLSLSHLSSSPEAIAQTLLSQNAKAFLPSSYDASLIRGFEAQRKVLAKHFTSPKSWVSAGAVPGTGFSVRILVKPTSRGTITLDPNNPTGPPVVQYGTLTNPVDATILIAMLRYTRNFWRNPIVAKFSPVEDRPGAQYQTDDEILFALTKLGFLLPGLAHPSGTCALGPERLGGCVGSDLRVHGVRGLSVVDASVIPLIPSVPLQATVYAIAEKAADLIKGRA